MNSQLNELSTFFTLIILHILSKDIYKHVNPVFMHNIIVRKRIFSLP